MLFVERQENQLSGLQNLAFSAPPVGKLLPHAPQCVLSISVRVVVSHRPIMKTPVCVNHPAQPSRRRRGLRSFLFRY